jgi:uncharacterized repeat protein (TIGR01451 family)/MYXO-CTERM domain-containing protein
MSIRRTIGIPCFAAALAASAGAAHAAPTLRVQVDQHGDFLLIGNTLGYDCAVGTPAPIVVGTLAADACAQSATNLSDSSPDVYWEADAPSAGSALADTSTLAADARSTAVLTVPAGATITHAFLYWAATNTSGVADTEVTLDRVGTGGFGPITVDSIQSWVPGVDDGYQSVADVTALVQQYGSGAYRVSGIDVAPFANVDKDVLFGGWWMVAFYQLDTDPLRDLALFDGFDVVKSGSDQSATLSGFLVPTTGFTGKLGVVAFEGDNTGTGDKLLFNNVALSDAENPVDNFFNSTRSWLGSPVSVAGDLPQLTGTPGSYAGVDLDVVDITAQLTMGQSSAPLQATTTGDTYYLGGFITSISTFVPDFTTSTKTATDLNGGLLIPGDVLRYTITAVDTGNDASAQTVLTDVLPAGVTYVPGSINIVSGDNAGMKTDAAGDDQAEYVAATRTVVVRLGKNASATMGGSIAAGASSVITFDVTIDSGVTGNIANQGSIQAGGLLGAPVTTVLTDGNGIVAGSPPTVVFVDQCATNADCAAPDPICNTAVSPHACVQCLTDSDCGGAMSGKVCDTTMDTCTDGCRGNGGNGCPQGQTCSSTTDMIGQCSTPSTSSGGGAGGAGASSSSAGSAAGGASSASSSGSGKTTGSGSGSGGAGSASGAASGAGGASTGSGNGTGGLSSGGNTGGANNDEGSGCDCNVAPGSAGLPWGLGVALAAALAGRRRRRG